MLLLVAPLSLPAILQPKDHRSRIGRKVLLVRHNDWLTVILKDLDRIVRVTNRSAVQ